MTEDERDVITTIYADDTQSRAAAKTIDELERRKVEVGVPANQSGVR